MMASKEKEYQEYRYWEYSCFHPEEGEKGGRERGRKLQREEIGVGKVQATEGGDRAGGN